MSSNHSEASHDPSSYRAGSAVLLFYLGFGYGLAVLAVAISFKRTFVHRHATARAPRGTAVLPLHRRRGLSQMAVAAIPAFAYARSARREDGRAGGWAQCAVCLGLVQEGEIMRQLPACKHLFHVECIDRWLCAHPTCPLCRADLSSGAAGASEKVEPGEVLV